MYTVKYVFENQVSENCFLFEHEAKHFALDIAYAGYNPAIYEFGKQIGRIETFGQAKAFVRV